MGLGIRLSTTFTGLGFSGHGLRICSPSTKFWSLHTYACSVSIWHVTTLHQSRSLISAFLIRDREEGKPNLDHL